MSIEFTDKEMRLIGLALTTSGMVGAGSRPSSSAMEILVLKRKEFFDLTTKVCNEIESIDTAQGEVKS